MSSGRRKLIPWSIGLAVVSIAGLVGGIVIMAMAGAGGRANQVEAEALGGLCTIISFLPALVGLALGIAALDKRLKTPGTVWIGIVGCGVVTLIWLGLMVVGALAH
jgi:hypothetical protein